MYTAEAEEELLGGAPDFVLDAIDNTHTKVRLHIPSRIWAHAYQGIMYLQ